MKKRWKDGYMALKGALREYANLLGAKIHLPCLPTDEEGQVNHLTCLMEKQAELNDLAVLLYSQDLSKADDYGRIRGKINRIYKRYFYDF